jgi:hypothetical protein
MTEETASPLKKQAAFGPRAIDGRAPLFNLFRAGFFWGAINDTHIRCQRNRGDFCCPSADNAGQGR